jgi:ABC-type phosphate transport system substrate-binding protein
MRAGESRKSPNAVLWSERLMEVAKAEMMKSTKEDKDDDSDDDNVSETEEGNAATEEYVKQTNDALGVSSDSDEDDGEEEED